MLRYSTNSEHKNSLIPCFLEDNKMSKSDYMSEAIGEEKLLGIWPEHPCLYDVRCPSFNDRVKRDEAFRDIATKLNKSGRLHMYSYIKTFMP